MKALRRLAMTLVLVSVAGCSSATVSGKKASTTSTTSSPTSTSTTLPAVSTSVSSTTSPTAAASRCASSQLRFGVARVLGRAASADGMFFSYTNVSNSPCTLDGYPVVQVDASNGTPMLSTLVHGGGQFFLDPGPRREVLAAGGGQAFFGFSWPSTGQPTVDQTGCVDRVTVESTPPGSSGSLSIELDFSVTPFTPVCHGTGGVTAVASKDAFTISSP